MDGIHDMGGMHGFGRVVPEGDERGPEADEPVFHAPWEARTLGLMIATGARGLRDGSIRPAIEEIDPATYLASSYYERWARAVEAQVVAAGHVTTAEIDERAAGGGAEPVRSDATDPALVTALPSFLNAPRARSGEPVPQARFVVGDRVTVARMAPEAHHRCPRTCAASRARWCRSPEGGRRRRTRARRPSRPTRCASP